MRCWLLRVSLMCPIVFALVSLPAHAEDARAHCSSVGNDDTVKTVPPRLIAGSANLFHESASEAAAHRCMYVYRCMSGSIWVCNHGANIPCAKGDTIRALPSVTAYCKENPNQDFVPMAVTGHSTIHSWVCVGGKARITQSKKIDSRGFVVDQWQRLQRLALRLQLQSNGSEQTSFAM
jgi:hypothetical protein